MARIKTDVLIVGTGPAGSAAAALLSSCGVENMVVNRYRWLANTPRAHITNQRTMEVLRDLGKEVEAEAYMHATDQDLMGENIFCESLAGEEIGRMKSWGKHPSRRAEHYLASPCFMNDLPQTFMEPILYSTACKRGTQGRMSTEYLKHKQDAKGVTTTLRDRLSGRKFQVRSKYLIGADGGNSTVAEHAGLPIEGQMGVGGSMNILFRADLSKYVAHRPSVLYWIMQPGADVGGIGMGVVRMVRPWNEWLIIWGYDINQPEPEVTEEFATGVARQLVGDPELEIDLISANTWTVNNAYAANMQNGRVFIMGDAAHRHPPSNGLGSNTSIQDAFNLAWKLAAVLKGQATPKLLDSYTVERAPIAKQIVTRANQSIAEFGPIFGALGMTGGTDYEKIKASMDARCDTGPEAEKQREAIREAIAFKKYEFDTHGVEMNQRYSSGAVVADGQKEPAFALDAELHYQPTTWPGARLPHVWVFGRDTGKQVSTLDLCGHGRFTLLTGIGGKAWAKAAAKTGAALGLDIAVHTIGPRQAYLDHTGDWARAREICDTGCLLVRPDHHVCWRAEKMAEKPRAELTRVLSQILGRGDAATTAKRSNVMEKRESGYFTEKNSAETVIARMEECTDPRLKEVMSAIVRHLHAAVKEIEPTQEEWMEAIQFLTRTGHMCTDWRQEFILLSDTLGVSMLVDAINSRRPTGASENTVLGPFHVDGAPEMEMGANICLDGKGEPMLVHGRILDVEGNPLEGAIIDVWQANDEGFYDVQQKGIQPDFNLRGKFRTGADGRYRFKAVKPRFYPIPDDGPVGQLLGRLGRHPYRPAHFHYIITKEGFDPLTTHIFDPDDPYIHSDAVFGVKESLMAKFDPVDDKAKQAENGFEGRYYDVEHDFVLAPERG